MSEKYALLNKINSPDDVKALQDRELCPLAEEIREFLVEHVTKTGGHLASNLGVVELSVALARVFDTPRDHIIFDVGHQSYVHKLLTGRRDAFDTLRQSGGLSGFMKRTESEHDCFGAGHSSTSLSAALGFAEADRMSGSDAYSVAVVGDGSFTGGMIHEALNNCAANLRLIIIINENEMSISKNIGHFAKNLSRIRSREKYLRSKERWARMLNKIPFVGKPIFKGLKRIKRFLKNWLYGSNYFENFGLYYLGPVDGNDMQAVEEILRVAKAQAGGVIVHLKTKKGKGYAPAEQNPSRYHGLGAEGVVSKNGFSLAFGEQLCRMAAEDDRICAITAAMCEGTGLSDFRRMYRERFFDVGIAEEHAVTFAAGLAACGKRPFVAIYSTFLQRAYDNVIHDVALQDLAVCFCIDRAGFHGADGPTHDGIFDVAFLYQIPNLTLYTPVTYEGLRLSLGAALKSDAPVAIRYAGGEECFSIKWHFYGEQPPRDISLRSDYGEGDSPDCVVITHGKIAQEVILAKEQLKKEGIFLGILLAEYLKPYDRLACEVTKWLPEGCPIVTVEEEIRAGGMGMLVLDALARIGALEGRQTEIIATDDRFGIQSENEPIYKTMGIDAQSIVRTVKKICPIRAGKGSF